MSEDTPSAEIDEGTQEADAMFKQSADKFANMVAGHVIILALIGLIFMFGFAVAVAAVLGAAMCVLQRSPVASAMWLMSTMFSLAAIFILLNAQLIGILQVLVYVGAIVILMLFGSKNVPKIARNIGKSLEELRKAHPTPQIYQFYFHKDRGLNAALVERAAAERLRGGGDTARASQAFIMASCARSSAAAGSPRPVPYRISW